MKRLLLAAAAWLFGCHPERGVGENYEVQVFVGDDRARAISRAKISVDGVDMGTTDNSGMLVIRLRARPNDAFDIGVMCPGEYDASAETRRLVAVSNALGTANQTKLDLLCTRRHRRRVLVIRSNRPRISIRVDGRERGLTNSRGVAHIEVRKLSGEAAEIVFDAHEFSQLRPQSQRYLIAVEDDGWDFVDVRFARQRGEKERASQTPKVSRPIRID